MITFHTVEDYIECMAGVKTSHLHIPPVTLARYDRSPVHSFVAQIATGAGFTDRQSQLALRLLSTYKRQLANVGVDVTDIIATPRFKYALRQIDRTKSATLDTAGNTIALKFPFNSAHIDTIREFADSSEGAVYFDRDAKLWKFALTESCVNFAVAFSTAAGFDVQGELTEFADAITAEDENTFLIELQHSDTGLAISNASTALLEYIETNNGLVQGNLPWLVDSSAKSGYTVSPQILESTAHAEFAVPFEIKLKKQNGAMQRLVDYAHAYNKFPIVSYQHETADAMQKEINQFFNPDEIVDLVRGLPSSPITEKTKVIHVIRGTSYKSLPDTIPLLLCYTNMMFGGVKSMMVQNADKVCYYCDTFYSEKTLGKFKKWNVN